MLHGRDSSAQLLRRKYKEVLFYLSARPGRKLLQRLILHQTEDQDHYGTLETDDRRCTVTVSPTAAQSCIELDV